MGFDDLTYRIDFEPVGLRGVFRQDQSLLEIARQLGVGLVSVCGGAGSCGQCKVQVLLGAVTPPTTVELLEFRESELASGYRDCVAISGMFFDKRITEKAIRR